MMQNQQGEATGHRAVPEKSWRRRKEKGALNAVSGLPVTGCGSDVDTCSRDSEK